MKNAIAKGGLRVFGMSLFLFGVMLLTTGSVTAQTLNWKQSDEAKAALLTAIDGFKADLNQPAGPVLNNAKAHVYYYKTIYSKIDSGLTTEEAVNSGFDFLTSSQTALNGPSNLDVTVDKAMRDLLRDDAVILLTH
ncbi:MAG: hypothetical protein IT260_23100 [Saprospiraceae bacterium]|nr:hypothetical protein [Saprospiraceae bacterium]